MGKRIGMAMARGYLKNVEFQKFIVGGLINTVIGYSGYLLLLMLSSSYSLSYIGSFIIGILCSYLVNSIFVFRTPLSLKKLLSFPIVYMVQLVLGYLLLYLFIDRLQINEVIAPLIVTAITVPVTFLLSKRIIKGKPSFQNREGS